MPGKLLEYITDFPRVVGGIDEESARRAVDLYRHIVKQEITPTDVLTAEMAKVVENAYRDVNIAFANEVALACERMGVNVFEVRELINARHDRHMHVPGAGVGGHCLPKDSWLLKYGLETYGRHGDKGTRGGGDRECRYSPFAIRLIPLAREINDGMPGHVLALIEDGLAEAGRELAGAKVVLMGVAYPSTSSGQAWRTPTTRATRQRRRWPGCCWRAGQRWWPTTPTCGRPTGGGCWESRGDKETRRQGDKEMGRWGEEKRRGRGGARERGRCWRFRWLMICGRR